MDEKWQEQGRGLRPRYLVAAALVVLFQTALVTLLIYFAVRANSEACRDGLRAQDECRNITHLLQRQLTRAQDGLLQAETQANTCNRTVVTLQDSLEKQASQVWEQQARIQELESKVMTLNLELEKLRTAEEASRTSQKNSASSVVLSSLLMLAVMLILLF